MAKRINAVAKEFNLGLNTIVDFLKKNHFDVDSNPNAKVDDEMYELLKKEFQPDAVEKQKTLEVDLSETRKEKDSVSLPTEDSHIFVPESETIEKSKKEGPKIIGKVDLNVVNKPTTPVKKHKEVVAAEPEKEEEIVEKITEKVVVEEKIEPEEIQEPVKTEQQEQEQNEEQQEPEKVEVEESKPKEEFFRPSNVSVQNTVKVVGTIDLKSLNQKTHPDRKTKEERLQERKEKIQQNNQSRTFSRQSSQRSNTHTQQREDAPRKRQEAEIYRTDVPKAKGPKIVDTIDLTDKNKSKSTSNTNTHDNKPAVKRRERLKGSKVNYGEKSLGSDKPVKKEFSHPDKSKHRKSVAVHGEINEEDVDRNIRDTMSKLGVNKKTKTSKYRREKREEIRQEMEAEEEKLQQEEKILKVTEFVSVHDLSAMMKVPAEEIISKCLSIGLFVALNQRLEADTIQMITEEFGFHVQFVSADIQEAIEDEAVDKPEDLLPRPPIVTVMGHVDHGKTSLLDYIRKSNVIAGEAGGITQHIGAYNVTLSSGRKITFLDTPGHEAFTAMRARGAQITDIAIIVVAADDNVMPQTVEAINHAAAAGVPIVFAINKIDKPGANPDKVREQLANMNYVVEEWGGKYQSQEIAAKFGKNVDVLMDKVLLEADMLELKANPHKPAQGTVVESKLDKGRGYTANLLISSGTLRVGDIVLAGMYAGKVKAMFNEREQKITEAGPSMPVMILGLDGAPQAGDKIHVMKSERDAREIANKRERLQREQELNAMKPKTLDDIARRIKIGNVQELNLIIKGDVGGSVEALSDSLLKLSTEEIEVVIKHKAVGQISEGDVLLASASDAIIIGFQVRPSSDARRMAEKLGIDIRLYSIIYDAINEVKDAMSGMLSPEIKEEVTGSCEIREVFKISKVGTIAGCFVTDGKIYRSSKVRIIRDGIVIFTGELASLRKVKDDVKEVTKGYECGLNINGYNDIQVGDIIEAYEEKEVKRQL